jgi:hypothetical protein
MTLYLFKPELELTKITKIRSQEFFPNFLQNMHLTNADTTDDNAE